MYAVLYDQAAEEDLRALRPYDVRRIMREVDTQLTKNPTLPGRRKKLLHGFIPPWDALRPIWQLRVGDFRVFYDVGAEQQEIIVRAVRRKGNKPTEEIL